MKKESLEILEYYQKVFEKELLEKEIKILSDLSFTNEDIEKIEDALKKLVSDNTLYGTLSSKDFTKDLKLAQLPFSLYLVWHGMAHYHEGNYWEPVMKSLGLVNTGHNQKILGDVFLKALEEWKLEKFQNEEALKYVTPILAHGKVPDDYLNDFFENLIYSYFYKRGITSLRDIQVELSEVQELRENFLDCILKHKMLTKILENWDLIENLYLFDKSMQSHFSGIRELLFSESIEELESGLKKLANIKEKFPQLKRKEELLNTFFALLSKEIKRIQKMPGILSCSDFVSSIERQSLKGISRFRLINFMKRTTGISKNVRDFHEVTSAYISTKKELLNIIKELEYIAKAKEFISPELEEKTSLETLDKQIKGIKKKIRRSLIILVSIGRGTRDEGEKFIQEQKEIINKLTERKIAKKELNELLDFIENSKLVDRNDFETELEKYEKLISFVENQELLNLMDSINKSTKAFIKYGGENAASFIYNCLKFLKELDQSEKIPDAINSPLSRRVYYAMFKWWKSRGTFEYSSKSSQKLLGEKKKITNSNFKFESQSHIKKHMSKKIEDPSIKLDIENYKFKIVSKEFWLESKDYKSITFEILGAKNQNNYKPKIEQQGQKLYVQPAERVLNKFEREFQIIFRLPGGKQNTYQVNMFPQDKPFEIFTHKYEYSRYVTDLDNIYYLVCPEKIYPYKGENICEEICQLSYEEKLYVYQVDPMNIRKTIIKDDINDKRYYLASFVLPNCFVVKTKRSKNLTSKNKDVWIEELPRIECCNIFPENIDSCQIIIKTSSSEKCLKFSELLEKGKSEFLEEISNTEQSKKIPLRLPDIKTYGEHKVKFIFKLADSQYEKDLYDFVRVPDIKIEFSKQFFIYSEEEKNGEVHFSIPNGFSIKWHKYENQNGKVIFPLSAPTLEGILYSPERDVEIPFVLKPPVLRWKFEDENDYMPIDHEIWKEDLKEIEIEIPFSYEEAILKPENVNQERRGKIKNSKFNCDLKTFHDTLTSKGTRAVTKFNICFAPKSWIRSYSKRYSQELECYQIFKIRTNFEIKDFEYKLVIKGNLLQLSFNWLTYGKPKNLIMKVWDEQTKELLSKKSNVMNKASIELPINKYGRHLKVNFEEYDAFYSNENFPNSNTPNTFDVHTITDMKEIIEISRKKGLLIENIYGPNSNEEIRQFKPIKQIIIKNLTKHDSIEEKVLFKGEIYFYHEKVEKKLGDYYLVIDSDNNKITAILNKPGSYGDCPMYCPKCGKLFLLLEEDAVHKEYHISVDGAKFSLGWDEHAD